MTESETPATPETPAAPEAPATPEMPPAPTAPVMAPPVPAPPTGDVAEPAAAPRRRGKRSPDGRYFLGTGRRKSSVARVRIAPGGSSGFVVNGKPLDEYFRLERDQKDVMSVLEKTRTAGKVDVTVKVHGGGTTGQAGAIVLGLGRALATMDSNLEGDLRDNGFLTRDPREVERKKYGQRGARRRYQFSKR